MVAATPVVSVFLCSVEGRFSAPAVFLEAVARCPGQSWPQAIAEATRNGLDAGEHKGILIEAGVRPPSPECGRT